MINPELDRLARARYVSLTTYKRDGTGVATPVRLVSEGGYLQVVTNRDSGQVERLRGESQLLIAPCDVRGELQGDPVPASATVIDDPQLLARASDLIVRRYGLIGWFTTWLARLRKQDRVVLVIDVPPVPEDDGQV